MKDKSGRPIIIKRIKKVHGGAHGGSWKVAYADFVTALMAFFLLLWLLSMVSPDKRAMMSEYFRNFSIFKESGASPLSDVNKVAAKSGADMKIAAIKAQVNAELLRKKIKAAVERKLKSMENQVIIDITESGVRIQITDEEGSVMFQKGSAQPTQKAKEILALLAENIKDTNNKIVVEGHTDSVPFRGEQTTNWELSTSRASAARRELEANGIEPSRIARVVGYSDQELLIKEDPENPRNRRISIILLKTDSNASAQKEIDSIITPQTFKKLASG
jgi:chemotaxis protein MotB